MEPNSIMEAITHPQTYIKPITAGGTILFIDKFIVKRASMSDSIALAGGVAGAFFLTELITPHLPKFHTAHFSSGAIEQRIVEVGVCGAALTGLQKVGIIKNPIVQFSPVGGIQDLIKNAGPALATILVADICSEGFLPFFGFDTRFHSKK
jgi:hypothetical protein